MAPLMLPKMSLVILVLCLILTFDNNSNNNYHEFHNNNNNYTSIDTIIPLSLSSVKSTFINNNNNKNNSSLEYDFYRNSCPQAESIVPIQRLYRTTPNLVHALIRLAFHDCFFQGCDASVLLDDDDYIDSKKESPLNGSLKGFDVIETIKSKLEETCPGVVSCADILVLAARDSVVLAGGPFYPLNTGRRDGSNTFADIATSKLPSPYGDLSQTIASFKSKGFDEREMITLLGAYSIGVNHCDFFRDRLYNFSGTNEPDPSLDIEFLNELRSRCNDNDTLSTSASGNRYTSDNSPSTSVEERPRKNMDTEKPISDFQALYHQSLLQGKGILYADQQLMEGEEIKYWVQEYASNPTLFRQHFSLAMMKLSDLRVLTPPMGQIRVKCSNVT